MSIPRWRAAASAMFTVATLACSSALDLTVRFPEVSGLREGAPVLWKESTIGQVREVRYTREGRFEVRVRVEEAFRAAVTDRTRFVVAGAEPGAKALELVELQAGGTPLADGAVVEGASRYEVLGESVRREVRRFFQGLQDLPESESVKSLREEIERFAEDLGRAGKEARERIKKQVLPEFERRLEELRRRLREGGREGELDPIERRLRELERT